MTIHVTPIPSTIDLVAPEFTLGLVNTAGSATTAVSSDSVLLTFDETVVTDISTATVSAATGEVALPSRRDHTHGSTAITAGASQAEMVAASVLTSYVTPGRTQYHPGIVKVWCRFNSDGGESITASYNMTSVTDGGDGIVTIAWGTDFSSGTVYGVTCSGMVADGNTPAIVGCKTGTFAAGGVTLLVINAGGSAVDGLEINFAAYGAQ